MVDRLSMVPWPTDGADFQDIDDETLVLVGQKLSRLTGTAALAVRASDGIRSVGDIARSLDVASGDLADAFAWLAAEGLVELHEPGPHVRYRKPDHVGACEDGDQVALVDLRDGRQHALSESGAQIWLVLTRTGTVESTVAELAEAYPDAAALADDTTRFVDDLVAAGLLERLPPLD